MASTPLVNQSVKLTKLVVDRTPLPPSGQHILRDAELMGFGLRVTAGGAKSFIVEKRVNGRVRRYTVGRYPGITAEQARKEAQKLLGRIIAGEDPHAQRKREEVLAVTLGTTFRDFLKIRSANLKERTLYDYRRVMEVAFGDWQVRAVTSLTKDMVAKRHRELGETRGQAYANLAMRVLRSVLNFARAQYEDPTTGHSILLENPIARLTNTRAWYRINRRQTVIRAHQLPAWFEAVAALKAGGLNFKGRPIFVRSEGPGAVFEKMSTDSSNRPIGPVGALNTSARRFLETLDVSSKTLDVSSKNLETMTRESLGPLRESLEPLRESSRLNTAETVGDFLLLLLFTGLRRQEATKLRWANVDLLERTLTIPDPKNHEPLRLPLSSFVYELLSDRSSRAANEYVFPGSGVEGYFIEPRAAIQCVIETSGVEFTLHDLRRTFITVADSLDIPAYAIKRLVNHKMRGDVTAGYIVSDVERLRRPMQQITDFILNTIHHDAGAEVVALSSRRASAEYA